MKTILRHIILLLITSLDFNYRSRDDTTETTTPATTPNTTKRDVIGRIETTGRNVMPPEGRLPQATIDIILDWEADGFKEN
jgi:hypothetical protein